MSHSEFPTDNRDSDRDPRDGGLFGDEIDEWGRPNRTEDEREYPPRHRPIEIVYDESTDEGFIISHPDEVGDPEIDEPWIKCDDASHGAPTQ